MTDRPEEASDASAAQEEAAQSRLIPQLTMMFRALLDSHVRDQLFILAGVLVAVVSATAYGQIRLNTWNQPFYDASERHNMEAFFHQLGVFGTITGALLVLNVGQRWLSEMLKLKLREGLAKDLIENWLQPLRAFRLASAGPIGVNPDQRMHEDARHLTELSADLGTGLLQAGILLALFVHVLWRISSDFAFHVGGCTLVQEKSVDIERGQRVLIVGEPGTGKTLLFRALAGLWPWGSGTITRPKGEAIEYMPRMPYWPPGSLREAMCYPLNVATFDEASVAAALQRMKLERLVPLLDGKRGWEQQLSEEELMGLAFARVLLHKPAWVLLDEVLDNLDADTLALITDAIGKELKDSTVIHIGRQMANDSTFKRVVHLIKDPTVRRLPRNGTRKRKPNGRQEPQPKTA